MSGTRAAGARARAWRAWLVGGVLLCGPGAMLLRAQTAPGDALATSSNAGAVLLKPAQLAGKLPDQVFFRGQSAAVQMRNSAGVQFGDGMLLLSTLVDTSGYSSGVQQKYQGYLITEVPLSVEGKSLPAGEYGVGFVEADRFLVMDVGAHELLTAKSTHDAALHRPMPLQILQDSGSSQAYRLYFGRSYVTLMRAK